jgi:hypothetical protein
LRLPAIFSLAAMAALVVMASVATTAGATTWIAKPFADGTGVAPAGQMKATLLAPQPKGHSAVTPGRPIRSMNPAALRAAKLQADAARPASSAVHSPAALAKATGSIFNGLNQPGLSAADEGSIATPPDSTGAIGPTRYIEMVNNMIGVYDRTNLALLSSADTPSFGNIPFGTNPTDVQIQWDPQSNRWLYTFIAFATGNNYLLFGWTKTADPSDLASGWCTYGVATGSSLQDYPKLGHDAHFLIVGSNVYDDSKAGFPFVTAEVWAITKPATTDTTCSSSITATYFADATHVLKNTDGTPAFTPVPANTADAATNDYIVAAHDVTVTAQSKVMIWHMTATPSPVLVPDGDVSVGSSFAMPPGVPQPGVAYLLDSLDGRLTQAVAHFDPTAGGEAVWTQHTVAGSGRSVVRWYEFLPATLRIYQQGQISSATDYIFNAAISPTSSGTDASISYSRGSSTQLAVIGAQTRTSATTLGRMDAGEIVLGTSAAANQEIAFQGNCTSAPCRWGDYSGASPDPNNSSVVWGSNQLIGPVAAGYAQWTTHNFAIATRPPGPDFTLSVSPGSQIVGQGSGATYSVTIARILGFSSSVTLSVSGLPSGATGTFSPNPVSGTASTLTIGTKATTPAGSYTFTVNGSGGSLTRSTIATLVVSGPDFALSATPNSQTVSAGLGTSYTIAITRYVAFSGTVSLSVSGLPSGAAGTFSPNPASGTSSTLGVTTASNTPTGSYPVTITGTSGSLTHTAGGTLVVNPPPPCATASVSPASVTQGAGSTVNLTASSTGCPNPQYEWWVQDLSGSWIMKQAFSASTTFNWNTAGLAPGVYTVHVWANQLGDQTGLGEAIGSSTVTLTGCTTASVSASPGSPQAFGPPVQFSATSTGCASPQYEFWLQDPSGGWTLKQAFSSSAVWNWSTTGGPAGNYTVHVWANQAGDPTATYEALASLGYTLTGPAACTSDAVTASPISSQATGTTIQFTATSTGCPSPLYEFWLQDTSGSWSIKQAFGASAIWIWNTTGYPAGNYTIHVWANQSGSDLSTWQANGGMSYTLTATSAPPCATASVTANPGSPQAYGPPVQFTATSTGCANPQYEFWLQDPSGGWTMKQAFSSSAVWNWSTTGGPVGTYTVHVWANQTGDPTATYEALASMTYTLVAPAACATDAVTASPSAPQAPGATIQFTATSTGCPNPLYEFWLQDTSGSWSIRQSFSSSAIWNWNTAGFPAGNYTIHVWANQSGSDLSTWQANGGMSYTLTAPAPCATATLSPANPAQAAGSTVNLTASSTGCPNPQYEFWVQYLDTNWYLKQGWGGPTFAWNTAGLAPGSYSVHVWANQIGDSTATWEANGATTVTLTGCTSASVVPATGSAAAGSLVTFTMSSTGCANPVYEFWLQDPSGAWQMVQAFGTGNTWQWNTAGWAKGTYTIHAWANQQYADMSAFETFGSSTFTLT